MIDRATIDAAFAAMENDAQYLAEAEAICEEFAASDWGALLLVEEEVRASE